MPVVQALIGLALGMLLTAAGLIAWSSLRGKPTQVALAAWPIRWVAGAILAAAALCAWIAGRDSNALILHLTWMAAIAAPPNDRRLGPLRGRDIVSTLPALALATGSLIAVSGFVRIGPSPSPITPMRLALIACNGVAARVLAEALAALVDPAAPLGRTLDILHLALTLLLGGTSLVHLWQRGVAWGELVGGEGLVGAWLAWSAALLCPGRHARLRAGLAIVATVLLTLALWD